jgi:ferritin-like protein
MVEWHRSNLDPEDIAKIIQEGREENDKKFETYAEYVGYIAKDNDRILNEYDHDHSQCEPNELTKEAMDEAIEDSMDDVFVSTLDGSESTLKEILEALGSDYDENGIPYWKKSKDYNAKQIEGRDNV